MSDQPLSILLINHYAGSAVHGMEYRPYFMSREWVRMGHDVTIVAASFSHLRQVNPCVNQTLVEEYIDGIRYCWLKTPSYQGNGAGRLLNMLRFVQQLHGCQKRIGMNRKFDVVIASSTYPLDIFPAQRIARRHGAKLVFEVHDLWPLSPMYLGGMSKYHPFVQLMQYGEDKACRSSDTVISLLPRADLHLRTRGMTRDKFHYVPNGIDRSAVVQSDSMLPLEHQRVIESLKRKRHVIIGYAGSIGPSNSMDQLIDAAFQLRDERVSFVIVGTGVERDRLQSVVLQKSIHNVHFLPPVPKVLVSTFLSQVDIAYLGWKHCPLYRFGISPNKLMDYMLAGKPIVQAVDAPNDLVAQTGCGVSIGPEDVVAIANAIRGLSTLSDGQRRAMGNRGKQYVLSKHDYTSLAGRFLEAVGVGHSIQAAA